VIEEIDPELAALIGGDSSSPDMPAQPKSASAASSFPPDFATLFGAVEQAPEPQESGDFDVDLGRKSFAPLEKIEDENGRDQLADPEYYKKVLGGEGDEAQRLHEILGKYLKAADPKDKGVFRQQLVPAFWYLHSKVSLHSVSPQAPLPKQLLIRYGALLPSLLSPENRDTLRRVIFDKTIDEPLFYADEWIKAVATGMIKASSTDEVKARPGDDRAKFSAIIQKAQGKRDAAEGIMKSKAEERRSFEAILKARVEDLTRHEAAPGLSQVPEPYTDIQKRSMGELAEIVRKMLASDKELVQSLSEFEKAGAELAATQEKASALGGESKADLQTVAREVETIKQMAKLCIGRQGNHFPFLTKDYFRGGIKEMGTRENIIKLFSWLESIDCEAFCRPYKTSLNRIVPFVVLLPCYGDIGICWEPFDRFNRASSRGRVALPMYPKNLLTAVVIAIADLRWQVAKEKASYYWMEEGLTGNYYQWFTAKKIKGDVKEFFIQDYLLWITKESEGIQKLDKEVRAVFWRFMPFAKEIKEKLKTRSFIYQELYQKDINRSLSDGY